jgi:signal recognition particle subunit SRP54
VNQLISQFNEMKDMMQTMQKLTSKGRSMNLSGLMDKLTGGKGGKSGLPGAGNIPGDLG